MWLIWISMGLGFPILFALVMTFKGPVLFDGGSTLAFYFVLIAVWTVSMGYTAGKERGRQEKAEFDVKLFQERLERERSDKLGKEK
jgi:hypothetical protein